MRRLPIRWIIVGLIVLGGAGSVFTSVRVYDVRALTNRIEQVQRVNLAATRHLCVTTHALTATLDSVKLVLGAAITSVEGRMTGEPAHDATLIRIRNVYQTQLARLDNQSRVLEHDAACERIL